MTAKPAFITFEGGDGAGKSTQIERLAARLRAAGVEVVTTREPGGSPGAESIRKLLVKGAADRWSPIAEALLMYAARVDHIEKTIQPALNRGAVVICDRFHDSTMAYQGVAGGLGSDPVKVLERLALRELRPDITFILDLPPKSGLGRAHSDDGETRFESKGEDFHELVRRGFLEIAKAEPARCVVIDASDTKDSTAAQIAAALKARLSHLFTT
ncbi:MAG: dTMP kinase [Pseudomonadota bacterium]